MSGGIWCNGQLGSAEDLRVSPFDRGLTVGLGLFETILAIEGSPVFLKRHLQRHGAGCVTLGWPVPDFETIDTAIRELIRANGLTTGNARIRLTQTSGSGAFNDTQLGEGAQTILTAVAAIPAPASFSVTFSKWPRNERSALVGLKCSCYAENVLALKEARRQGYDETYFLNTRGEICEAATANLFVVKNGRIKTPPLSSGCLPGVTRGWLLDGQFDVEEANVSRDDLLEADEIFLTSATRGPVPVSRLDGREYGPADLTARIRAEWESAIRRKDGT